jgi:hypothetical protein
MKFCTKCQTEKKDKEFYKNSKTKDGLAIYCKKCMSKYKQKEPTEPFLKVLMKIAFCNSDTIDIKNNKIVAKYHDNHAMLQDLSLLLDKDIDLSMKNQHLYMNI